MRCFFHYTIRDLLWLTLAVALALAWWLRERQLQVEVDRTSNLATQWRGAAGALEEALRDDGCALEWERDLTSVCVYRFDYARTQKRVISTSSFEPSAPK